MPNEQKAIVGSFDQYSESKDIECQCLECLWTRECDAQCAAIDAAQELDTLKIES